MRRNFTDIFKTPGKLRGKTPRTARKQGAGGVRQPLTDIFAPNVPTPASAQKTAFLDKVAHFKVPEDVENQPPPQHRAASRGKSPQRIGKHINWDSGYHGMTEDEMETDSKTETATESSQQSVIQKVPLRENQLPPQRVNVGVDGGNSSDESFTSAREELTARILGGEQPVNAKDAVETVAIDAMDVDEQAGENAKHADESEPMDEDQELEDNPSRSQSDLSSPAKPLQRKSSFTFTALPPRDPLTATKSFGARNSQADRNSVLGKSFGGKSFGVTPTDEDEFVESKSEESKAHNKTSTQLLHEKINMLGKTKDPRPSKSLHQTVLASQAAYPQLPAAEPTKTPAAVQEDSDDDWIAPTKPAQQQTVKPLPELPTNHAPTPERPAMHQKSVSTTQIPSPRRPEMDAESRHQKAISVSNPSLAPDAAESTTPAGSPPSKKSHEGPLSASKNRLYSMLKSAKSVFASSSSASAAAKLEAHNTSPSRSPRRDLSDESKTAAVFNMPGALYSERQLPQSPNRPISIMSKSTISLSPSKKSRASNESDKKREKELKAQQKAAEDLGKAREKERQKAAKQQEDKLKAEQAEATKKEKEAQKQMQSERPATADSEKSKEADGPSQSTAKGMFATGKLRAPQRLTKPTTHASKPAPVSIRVASQSQRLHQAPSTTSLSKSQHESAGPPVPAKPQTTTRPPSAQGRPGSAQGSVRSSTAPNNARVKALEAAARKKEADDKAAQKKLDAKKELERKRAAKAEDERRAEEQRKAAEQQRLQETKMAKEQERQAAEAKKLEQQRLGKQRRDEDAQVKAAHELAEAIKRERAQQQQQPPHPRGDVGGTLRQLAKNTVPETSVNRPPIQPNPAKPAKRMWNPDDEEPVRQAPQPPQRPGLQRGPPSYQQNDAKRRRTNEEEQQPEERPSVMAPPMRPSNMRKVSRSNYGYDKLFNVEQESGLSKFPHGYTHAPPPSHHPASMFKSTVTAQHQLQHGPKPGMPVHPSQLVQVSNARIPFAENANPPGQAQHHGQGQVHAVHENMHPSAHQHKFKTPVRPAQAPKSAKSSPLYPNGDNIQLPDIATDSEDEDSDDDDNTGFRAPSWVASPALRDLLTQQQLVDPESVFGPIGELKMEEVFRNGKNQERLKKLRDRSSSAAWVLNGDAVTSAEKRKDMELRERVARDGGWRYEPQS